MAIRYDIYIAFYIERDPPVAGNYFVFGDSRLSKFLMMRRTPFLGWYFVATHINFSALPLIGLSKFGTLTRWRKLIHPICLCFILNFFFLLRFCFVCVFPDEFNWLNLC